MKQLFAFGITALILLFVSCGSPTERELYEDEIDGFSYKTYKTLSGSVIGPAIIVYNTTASDSEKISSDYMRLLLGYSWSIAQKSNFSFAESNIVIENSKDENAVALAHILLSIGMYEKGWKQIAKEESTIGMKQFGKDGDQNQAYTQMLVIHLLAGVVSIYDRNFDMARFHFAGIGQLTGVNWPYILVDAIGDIDSGDYQKGLVKLKKASQDPSVPEEIRSALADLIKEVEKTTGNVESPLFVPKLIGKYLFNELKNSTSKGIKSLFALPEELKNKVSI
ncbi:MAG: hypothetical protein HY951_12645 [Bacteroidia bacterium]|nr:hypothetical protein [Bacteroidia bacterium]